MAVHSFLVAFVFAALSFSSADPTIDSGPSKIQRLKVRPDKDVMANMKPSWNDEGVQNPCGNFQKELQEIEERLNKKHSQELDDLRHSQILLFEAVTELQDFIFRLDDVLVPDTKVPDRRNLGKENATKLRKKLHQLQVTTNKAVQELSALNTRVEVAEILVEGIYGKLDSRVTALESGFARITDSQENSSSMPASHCGCSACTDAVWNSQAPAGGGALFTCGSRITYLEGQGYSEHDACRAIAQDEHPDECSACNPDTCGSVSALGSRTPEPTWAPLSPPLTPSTPIYCFPDYNLRERWDNVWGLYNLEVKRDPAGGVCGPGNNLFSKDTVSLNANKDELTLQYKMVGGVWEASEVRILLPDTMMPYTYGTYKFSVKSVATIDSSTGQITSTSLSEDLVVGFFTWDATERYDVHENWNHEVDIEISRWGIPNNADVQYVVQPPEEPHYYRFFSGPGDTYSPGGKTYEFTWNPTSISWNTSAGQAYSYTTKQALDLNLPDRIQCMPADVEVRINIWNKNGAIAPVGMADNHIAQVVIDSFSFTPSNIEGVADGAECSKHCQCLGTSLCVNSACTAQP